ncbi:MAG: shikimate kinase [Planctomycetota bacterium]
MSKPRVEPLASLPRIKLIGYRGTGKTTVAKHLAKLCGWAWVDTDDLIEESAGKSIAAIFSGDGEPAFRDLEEQAVADACQRVQTVIALGGGAVLREENRQRLQASGPVVWLTASIETLVERLAGDDTTGTRRPNLTARGGLAEIEQVLAERAPIYDACSDLKVDTEDRAPHEIAEQILHRFATP